MPIMLSVRFGSNSIRSSIAKRPLSGHDSAERDRKEADRIAYVQILLFVVDAKKAENEANDHKNGDPAKVVNMPGGTKTSEVVDCSIRLQTSFRRVGAYQSGGGRRQVGHRISLM